jgi:hypothetical protein
MNQTNLLSELDLVADNIYYKTENYITDKLTVSKNQFGYHWSIKMLGKKFSVSSCSLDKLTGEQIEFLKTHYRAEAKYILDENNITELWLKDSDEFIPIDEDLIQYKSGKESRQAHGMLGFTFLPCENNNKATWSPVPLPMPSKPSEFDDLKALIAAEKQKFVPKLAPEVPAAPKKPSIPLEQRKENLKSFILDFDNQLHRIFKDLPNKEINIANDGFITFSMLIEPDSKENKDHNQIVMERNHRGSRLDTIDGEAMFAYLMNPIYDHLGFDRREDPDRKHYTGMGDSGDFKYGTTRLDMKTRRKESGRLCNLLVNKGHEDFNMYGLVLREGDADCLGGQRRLNFVGVASKEVVIAKPAQMINKAYKYEVGMHQLSSLRDFIMDVLMEVIQKEEA